MSGSGYLPLYGQVGQICNPIIRGLINYYGRFNSSAILGGLDHIKLAFGALGNL
ncbi:MAG: hypothetical protein KKD01_14965 [Proteobacteria bacterium]|nr:hypothetical protein [Pseudomonadota bacterium]MBU1233538.1 hypothetical protein [Pseudomonadota bacterium]MBU1418663.1 hypothetical protein [Pseudomonadota bacterium]MBU1456023.1 hypothetical protein [Pseudomonadota bacterium]